MDLTDSVYERIKSDITHWRYRPGQRLPAEVLATEHGVSRTPVREALRRLEQEKLVTYAPKHGYSVRSIELKEFNELYEARAVIECYTVRHAAEHLASDAGVRLIEELRDTWAQRGANPPQAQAPEVVYDDEAFHETIALVSGNRILHELLRSINERIRSVRIVDFHHQDRIEVTYTEHQKIIQAILNGDGDRAVQLMSRHIENSKNHIKDNLMFALFRTFQE